MIKRVYGDKVEVFSIVDIESINIGRRVGYSVNRIGVPENIKQISGTKIRESKAAVNVPRAVSQYIKTVCPTFWFFGLPCSGKTTLALELKKYLEDKNNHIVQFDGDVLRKGLNQDLSFSDSDRKENLRRAANLAQMFNSKGHAVMCSFVTPSNEMRKIIDSIIDNIAWIYVKCSADECMRRDIKGMYAKAKAGEIKDFTGVSASFDEPIKKFADVIVDSEKEEIGQSVNKIIKQARQIDL